MLQRLERAGFAFLTVLGLMLVGGPASAHPIIKVSFGACTYSLGAELCTYEVTGPVHAPARALLRTLRQNVTPVTIGRRTKPAGNGLVGLGYLKHGNPPPPVVSQSSQAMPAELPVQLFDCVNDYEVYGRVCTFRITGTQATEDADFLNTLVQQLPTALGGYYFETVVVEGMLAKHLIGDATFPFYPPPPPQPAR